MGITSLQVCMDASDLLQGTMSSDDCGLDFSSSPTSAGAADHHMLACSRAAPMMERRLRPPHDQALKCPRCESTHTKFCYYNNYSLSQPRYFCKTCRRYWTKGGTLRNIPVGGGCRKNKKSSSSSSKKSTSSSSNDVGSAANSTSIMVPNHHHLIGNSTNPLGLGSGSSSSTSPHGTTDLQLAFPDLQFSPLISSLMMGAQGVGGAVGGTNFLDAKYNALLENVHQSNGCSMGGLRPIDFMDSKFDPLVGHAAASATTRTHHGHDDDHHHNMISSRLMGGAGGLDFSIMGGGGGLGDVGLHDHHQHHGGLTTTSTNFNPYGAAASHIEGTGININPNVMMDSCQRLMIPTYDHHQTGAAAVSSVDVKPGANKLLSLEWQQQEDHHQQQQQGQGGGVGVGVGGGHVSNVIGLSSSWVGNNMLSGYGPSTTNPLV